MPLQHAGIARARFSKSAAASPALPSRISRQPRRNSASARLRLAAGAIAGSADRALDGDLELVDRVVEIGVPGQRRPLGVDLGERELRVGLLGLALGRRVGLAGALGRRAGRRTGRSGRAGGRARPCRGRGSSRAWRAAGGAVSHSPRSIASTARLVIVTGDCGSIASAWSSSACAARGSLSASNACSLIVSTRPRWIVTSPGRSSRAASNRWRASLQLVLVELRLAGEHEQVAARPRPAASRPRRRRAAGR